MNPEILKLLLSLSPELMALAKDAIVLFKKHPQLTPDLLVLVVSAIHTANADTLSVIATDQASHQ